MRPIYLDHNATTPVLPEVLDAMLPYLTEHFGNPSSGHPYGRAARAALDRAREQVAAALDCQPDEVVFTSGGTEASNLAIRGAVRARPGRRRVVTTAIEHPATARVCDRLEAQGWEVARVGVDAAGLVDLAAADAALQRDPALLTIIHAHNETGVIQPVEALAARARERGALVHADAAQSVGKIATSVNALGVDLLSLAGHKLHAPKGVGALYVRRGTPLAPLLLGADHEHGLRPGTENVAAIVALGAACALVARDREPVAARVRALRDRLWGLLAAGVPALALHGDLERRLPNTLSVRFPGVAGAAVLAFAPEVAASTGSACHDGQARAPAAIVAMGVAPEAALGTVRLTLGRGTREEDVERAAAALLRGFARAQTGEASA